MKQVIFEEDEYIVMAMFKAASRRETIAGIEEILPFIRDDTELLQVVTETVEKMKRLPDADFLELDLEPYRQEPEAE